MSTQDRRPTSTHTVGYVYWYPTSGAGWDKIDEETPDDASTYVYDWNSADTDGDFGFSAFSVTGTVSSLTAHFRILRQSSSCIGIRPYIIVNGTKYYGNWETPTVNVWTDYYYEWTTNPDTGSAWEVDDINGTGSHPLQYMGLGIGGYEGTSYYNRCTQYYLTCTYSSVTYEYGSGTLSGAGTLTGDGFRNRHGDAVLSGIGTLIGNAKRQRPGVASIAGSGLIATLATRIRTSSALMTGIGSMVASAVDFAIHAVMAGVGMLSCLAGRTRSVAATLSGGGFLSAAAIVLGQILEGIATMTGFGNLDALAGRIRNVPTLISGSGFLAAKAWFHTHAKAVMSGIGSVSAIAKIISAFGTLRRWTGSTWEKTILRVRVDGAWASKILRFYDGSEWKNIDTDG